MMKSSLVTTVVLLLCSIAHTREKTYQTTRLIEMSAGATGFCFAVQLGDLAYVVVAHGRVPKEMIVDDPIQVRINNDDLFVRRATTLNNDATEIKGRIRVRKRMTGNSKLPSCALAVTLH